jgi:hypothetical protein
MPWIVTSYKSKHVKRARKMKATFLFNETEIGRLAVQPDYCYTVVNTTSRRVSKVGGLCRKATPQGLWGSRLRDGAPAATAAAPKVPAVPTQPIAGWWPFGKKKPPAKAKVNPMSKRMIWEPGRPSQMFGRSKRKRGRR